MIHYDLRCAAEHAFDGWFKDSTSFEQQAKRGLLECPVCGDTHVTRGLMTPAVPRKGRAAKAPALPAPTAPTVAPGTPPVPAAVPVAGAALPAQVVSMLQRLRAEVERNCDYVGDAFADEVRRIHQGEAVVRGIYGETTPDQAEALRDEGIQIASIPWVPRADG